MWRWSSGVLISSSAVPAALMTSNLTLPEPIQLTSELHFHAKQLLKLPAVQSPCCHPCCASSNDDMNPRVMLIAHAVPKVAYP